MEGEGEGDGSLERRGVERGERVAEPSPLKTGSELRIVNTSLSIGSGIEGYIDHFSIMRPDNADPLGPKHRVDYLSTDRLKKLRNFRDAGSCL